MTWLGIKLLLGGWLKCLSEAFSALLGLARRYPLQAALVVALCACGWLWHGNNVRDRKIAQRDAQIAEMLDAQKAATAAQVAMNKAWQDKTAQLAKEADNARQDALRSSAARFADSRRVRAYCGSPGETTSAIPNSPSPDRDGPGADAVVLTRNEYDQFVENSLRLERVRQWGDSLIKEGLAVPEVGF